jgi:hypothetical protein
MQGVGNPDAFAALFAAPAPVNGVSLELPFDPDNAPVDTAFWSALAEWKTKSALTLDDGRRLRRAAVPLRHRGALTAQVVTPRLEAHVHPFGIGVLSTFDLTWEPPLPLSEVWEEIDQASKQPAQGTLGGVIFKSTLSNATQVGAATLLKAFESPAGHTWPVGDHRIATVIDGVVAGAPKGMPVAKDAVHVAIHRLSAGGLVLPPPGNAFVAQWSGASFDWAPERLVYMLDVGSSLISPAAIEGPFSATYSTSAHHRRIVLLLSHVTAAVGLVRATPLTQSPYFEDWGKKAADRLGRLYGPANASDDWGLETRSYLARIGAVQEVGDLRGSALTEKFPSPPYP